MGLEQQGFFVKIRDKLFRGPFDNLSIAREEARAIGPNLLIYHGVLKYISEDLIDDSQLFLVPKTAK
jgi:hypothetical protein